MKKRALAFLLIAIILILSIAFVSAFSFKEFFSKITGRAIIDSDLIAYYKFDGNLNNEKGGSATSYGNPTYITTGKLGNAIYLDGIDDYIKLTPISPQLGTFSLWVKFNKNLLADNKGYVILGLGNSGGDQNYIDLRKTRNNDIVFRYRRKGVDYEVKRIGMAEADNWHYYTAVWNTNEIRLYINGVLIGTTTKISDSIPSLNQARIGARGFLTPALYFRGQIDELRFFSNDLTTEQVKELYDSYFPPTQICGNGIIEGTEVCDSNSQECTINNQAGTQSCNSQCTGWNECIATEACGNEIIEQTEECDDGTDPYDVELISASDTSATIKVTNPSGISETKEINLNIKKIINGLTITLINSDESPTGISVMLDINGMKYILKNNNPKKTITRIDTYYTINSQDDDGSCVIDSSRGEYQCKNNFCGDGYLNIAIEQCDDGNLINGDGCSSTCQIVTIPASADMEVSIGTLKDSYAINEPIQLTDPPDEVTENIPTELTIPSTDDFVTNQEEEMPKDGIPSDYKNPIPNENLQFGYIVKFKENPITVEEVELKEKAEKNEELIKENPIITTITGSRLFATREADVPKKVKKHKEKLSSEHKRAKDKIKQKLYKPEKKLITGNIIARITGKAIDDSVFEQKTLAEYDTAFNGIALNITAEEAESLKSISEVEEVYPNLEVKATLMDSVPLINADDVWLLDSNGNNCIQSGNECLTGKGVTIGIIDTGVDYTHPDLGGSSFPNSKVVGGWDFVNNDADPKDDAGHGTHVASIAAGNGILKGVAPDAKIYAYKVLNSQGSGSFSNIIASIERATDPNQDGDTSDHLDIISLSLGGSGNPDDPQSQAVDNAASVGITAVIAAGNSGPGASTVGSPGTARKAITVGATYKKDYEGQYWQDLNPRVDQIASFSSRGPVEWIDTEGNKQYLLKPDIVAPGAVICAAGYDPDPPEPPYPCLYMQYITLAGTSMATPHVSGAAALLKQAHPEWRPLEIRAALTNTAIDLQESINKQGYGRLNVLDAINYEAQISELNLPGRLNGIINIIGSASGNSFGSYVLYYTNIENPTQWIEITRSNVPVENDILYPNFDTSSLADGLYYIKLEVASSAGNIERTLSLVLIDNNYITYPKNFDLLKWDPKADEFINSKQGTINIKGTIFNPNLNNYEIILCREDNCFNSGITLVNEGRNQVIDGTLATLDVSQVVELQGEGEYTMKLKVNLVGGISREESITFWIVDYLDGWPKSTTGLVYSAPIVSDLNNDGDDEIIFGGGTHNNKLTIFNHDGTPLFGWPKSILDKSTGGTPAVGDLDNDGYKEIVVSGYSTGSTSIGKLYVFNHDGTTPSGWPFSGAAFYRSPTIADINQDGFKDIVVTSVPTSSNYIYVFNHDGTIQLGWPKSVGFIKTDPVIADINNDGLNEIMIASPSQLYVFKHDGSLLMQKSICGSTCTTDYDNGLTVGDLDNNGYKDIIVLANGYIPFGGWKSRIHAFDISGNELSGFPIDISGKLGDRPAIGDVNNDNKLEIFTTVNNPSGIFVFGIKSDGTPFWVEPYLHIEQDGYYYDSNSIILGDVSGDGNIDIISSAIEPGLWPRIGKIFAWNLDKSIISGYPKILKYASHGGNPHSLSLGDIDNNDILDIIGVSGFSYIENGLVSLAEFYVKNGRVSYNPQNFPWPMFQHDPQHTGCYDCAPPQPPPVPQSKIVNNENRDIAVRVVVKIQKQQGTEWIDTQNQYDQLTTIPANNLIKLDKIINPLNFVVQEAGNYRVHLSLRRENEEVVTNLQGRPLETSYEFIVA